MKPDEDNKLATHVAVVALRTYDNSGRDNLDNKDEVEGKSCIVGYAG